jgi:hypothetical protein
MPQRKMLNDVTSKKRPERSAGHSPDYVVIHGRWMAGDDRHSIGHVRIRYIDRKGRVRTCYASSMMSAAIHTAIMSQPEEEQCRRQLTTSIEHTAEPSPSLSNPASIVSAMAAPGGTAHEDVRQNNKKADRHAEEQPNVDPSVASQRAANKSRGAAGKMPSVHQPAITKRAATSGQPRR